MVKQGTMFSLAGVAIAAKMFLSITAGATMLHTACAQSWVIDSLYHQGQYRYWGAYLPAAYDGTAPWPAVLCLHGGGGNALSTVGFTQMNLVADSAHFIVIYPQGTEVDGNCCSWAAGVGSPADTSGIDDVLFFNRLLDTLNLMLNIDTGRVYSTGLSQGGFMSQRLACELSHRIAAIAPLCSNLDSVQMAACAPARPIPVLVINGTADLLVPYDGASFTNNGWFLDYYPTDSLIRFWASMNGCDPVPLMQSLPDTDLSDNSTVDRFAFGDCDCGTATTLYRVNGGGHTWPGVENPLYELIAGETNEDIHASVDIWNFFKDHSLACNSSTSAGVRRPSPNIEVSPNPTDGPLCVTMAEGPDREVLIMDFLGSVLRTFRIDPERTCLDLSDLCSGAYVIVAGAAHATVIKH